MNGLTSFVYDARDELTSETSQRGGSYSAALVYDGVTTNTTTGPGNATTERGVGFTFDSHGDNQIASDRNGHAWAYDGDGNPVTYQSYANAFDPKNRMTAYGIPTGGGHARLAMGYDDTGMRAWKEPTNLARVYFLYDGSDIIAELTGTGALSTYQTTGADGVVSRRSGSTSTFYAFDPEGSPSAVLSSTGGVLGDEVLEANGRRDSAYSSRPVDFGGQWGYYGDAETSLTLLGHRYFDSYAGRFLTRDPIGYDGGVNLYSYTANDYENESDPYGLSAVLVAYLIRGALVTDVAGGGPVDPFADGAAAVILAVAGTIVAVDAINAAEAEESNEQSANSGSIYTPDRLLPSKPDGTRLREKCPSGNGRVQAPHTQLGRLRSGEPAAREWPQGGPNKRGYPTREIHWSDHRTPDIHPDNPHQREFDPKTGQRTDNKPFP